MMHISLRQKQQVMKQQQQQQPEQLNRAATDAY
jgi:hypothetical protein